MRAGIAGAGIMGRLLALMLVKLGWEVTLFTQDKQQACSFAAAGMLAPLAELEHNDPLIYPLGLQALNQHWPAFLDLLPEVIEFQKMGSLVLAHSKDQAEFKHFTQFLPPEGKHRLLNHDEIIAMEKELTRFQHAYFLAEEGWIDVHALLNALGIFLNEHVHFIETTCSHVQPGCITTPDKQYPFDWVFDCRGLGAKSIFTDLRGIRGELIWLHAPDVAISRPLRFLHPRYRLYIVPRKNNVYLIGASEIESASSEPITVRTALELLTAAYTIQPKFAEAHIIKTVVDCRPALSNHLPKIKQTEGLIAINGLYRHGFLIAPSLAHEVEQFLQHGKTALQYPQLWETAA